MGMLALTRRVNEEIVIGDPAKPLGVIRVVSVHGDKVRLSFDFPKEVMINRKELADAKAKIARGEGPGSGGGNPGPGSSPGGGNGPGPAPGGGGGDNNKGNGPGQ